MPGQGRPMSRIECILLIHSTLSDTFSPAGGRPDFMYEPTLYSPRLELKDIEALERDILRSLEQCRRAVERDKEVPFVIPTATINPITKEQGHCCGDNRRYPADEIYPR